MNTVTISSKYQVVIPRFVRERMGIKAGQKFQIIQYGDRIEFIPLKKISRMRGFLKGIDSVVERKKDRL
jgi:AbrB family looped-hinge helix DNA binding protein